MSTIKGKICWQQLVNAQNEIIQSGGEITKNDNRIWKYLNKSATAFDDVDWKNFLLYFFEVICSEYSYAVRTDDFELYATLVDELPEQPKMGDHTFYGKAYQSTAIKHQMWKVAMRSREIWNLIHNIDVVNRPGSDPVKESATRSFNNVFVLDQQ